MPTKRAFYRFHSSLMEPWDGPASVAFTDGTVIGAVLDRNGLRPSRYWVTDDDLVVLASEVGVLDIDPAKIVRKGRLQPGRMFLIDTAQGRIVEDDEIKRTLAEAQPYAQWLDDGRGRARRAARARARRVQPPERAAPPAGVRVHARGAEDHRRADGQGRCRADRVDGHRHADRRAQSSGRGCCSTTSSSCSRRSPIRRSTRFARRWSPRSAARWGRRPTCCEPRPESCRQLTLPFPVIDNDELAKIIHINDADPGEAGTYPELAAVVISGLYRVAGGGLALKRALDAISPRSARRSTDGARIVVLSDRNSDDVYAPIPSLLLTSAVHHHLIREKQRTKVGLIVECGDAREVHHMALLIGYGAGAINPYLAFESIEDMVRENLHGLGGMDPHKAVKNYIKAAGKGVLKVMSKMGVSTVASYTGAQIFEAIGLGHELVDEYFTGTVSRLGGIGLDEVAAEVAARHKVAHPPRPAERAHRKLELGGEYQWRREGEVHLFNPETVFKLQHATRAKRYDIFKQYTALVDDQAKKLATLRGSVRLQTRATASRSSIDEVEPVSEIVKRFSTGAMSYGSISAEAHETLAIAMNSIGGKSNTGEGGEDSDRLYDPRATQRHQAGCQRTLRRDQRIPRQRHRSADQDGAGRQARRGWTAAGPQGVSVDRCDPVLDAGRRL